MLKARLFILKYILIRKSTNCTLLNVLCQFSSACRTRIIGQLLYFEFFVQDQNSVASGSVHSFELHVQQDTLSPSFQANGKNRKHKRNHSNLTAGRWSVNCRIAELSFKNSETFVFLIWFVQWLYDLQGSGSLDSVSLGNYSLENNNYRTGNC